MCGFARPMPLNLLGFWSCAYRLMRKNIDGAYFETKTCTKCNCFAQISKCDHRSATMHRSFSEGTQEFVNFCHAMQSKNRICRSFGAKVVEPFRITCTTFWKYIIKNDLFDQSVVKKAIQKVEYFLWFAFGKFTFQAASFHSYTVDEHYLHEHARTTSS